MQNPLTTRPGRVARPETDAPLEDRLTEHLLRSGPWAERVQRAKTIAADLGVPYSSVTAHLRRLVSAGRVRLAYSVNPYRTRFCHEYRIGLQVDVHRVRLAHDDHRRSSAPRPSTEAIEWFLNDLVSAVRENPALAEHLVITDMVMLHGAPGRDVEITVLTDDGIFSVGQYVREVLASRPYVIQSTTQTVSWRACHGGYCGQHTGTKSISRDGDAS